MSPAIPLPPQADIHRCVESALTEDLGSGDITARLIPKDTLCQARLIARESAILCGLAWADEVLRQVDSQATIAWRVADGDAVHPGQLLATLSGRARSLLSAERSLLNFLQTLSGTATVSRHYAGLVAGTGVRLLDTRKTLPGLRRAQKYAVAVGGCHNHRLGLYDAYLIKENHIRACGSITQAVARARQLDAVKPIEVEIESLAQLDEALDSGADIVMLDNFSLTDMRAAVAKAKGRVTLEASGGINREMLLTVAETGVDCISLGVLTKDCKSVDLSLLFAWGTSG